MIYVIQVRWQFASRIRTVRNMESFIPKVNLRNYCVQLVFYKKESSYRCMYFFHLYKFLSADCKIILLFIITESVGQLNSSYTNVARGGWLKVQPTWNAVPKLTDNEHPSHTPPPPLPGLPKELWQSHNNSANYKLGNIILIITVILP